MYHISPDKRSYESSGMIYDALAELMKEKEYGKIKINELCERAKLGRVTFYRHYDTIDDVLRKKIDDMLLEFKGYYAEFKQQAPDTPGLFLPLLSFFYVNPTIVRLIFQSRQLYILKESMYDFFKAFDEQCNCTNTDYLVTIRVSVFLGILEKWVTDGMNIPPDDLIKTIKQDMMTIALERMK